MKKLLAIICLVMLFSVASTPVATVDEAEVARGVDYAFEIPIR
jgi:hypothetical protein